jgi:hypothetical protein
MYGPKKIDGVYRSKYNFELNRQPKCHRRRKEQYVALLWAHDKRCLLQETLFKAIPEGRRNQGRPKFREDGMIRDSMAHGARGP